jgi:hypothetical protein
MRMHVQVMQRVLVLASTLDLLIPSQAEAGELSKLLSHCRTRLLPNRSHAVLQVPPLHHPPFKKPQFQLFEFKLRNTQSASDTFPRP